MSPMSADPTYLFVYGTLMPGRLRWRILAPFARSHRPAEVAGRLYDSGYGWPVAAFGSAGVIPGVLVELEPMLLDEALSILDDVEETATDTLQRIEVITLDGVQTWAYHFAHSAEGFEPIERWADQPER